MKHRTNTPHIFVTLIAFTSLMLPLRSARAQVAINGPETPATQTLNAWYTQTLPACFQAKDRVTLFPLDDRAMDRYLKSVGLEDGASYASDNGDGEIMGLFAERQKRISLRVAPSGAMDLQTLTHEYGHYVWFHLLGKDDRKQYRALYKRQAASRALVSNYAETNLEEGFAEAFAFYVRQPAVLKSRDAASFQFIADWAAARQAAAPRP